MILDRGAGEGPDLRGTRCGTGTRDEESYGGIRHACA
eukprot:CAMPEP_0182617902 /NCGR_PEP_ID=MMETSP1330-20130603/43772_1 /TAXON_ID=464278 /ORGANISM="Picochlorum sp., Strain RCC944" /LENGTH=36 /DNA_ID= /DNA_START= /DNA_END= /DNA_ORIENTATION=